MDVFANNAALTWTAPSLKGITYRCLQVSRAVSDNLSCNYYLLRRNRRKFDPLVQPGRVAYKIHLNSVARREVARHRKEQEEMRQEECATWRGSNIQFGRHWAADPWYRGNWTRKTLTFLLRPLPILSAGTSAGGCHGLTGRGGRANSKGLLPSSSRRISVAATSSTSFAVVLASLSASSLPAFSLLACSCYFQRKYRNTLRGSWGGGSVPRELRCLFTLPKDARLPLSWQLVLPIYHTF